MDVTTELAPAYAGAGVQKLHETMQFAKEIRCYRELRQLLDMQFLWRVRWSLLQYNGFELVFKVPDSRPGFQVCSQVFRGSKFGGVRLKC